MSYKSEWRRLKDDLDRAGYQTNVFDENFSGALDTIEDAESRYKREDARSVQRRKDAAREAIRIGGKYESYVRVATDTANGQVSPALKTAAGRADSWIMGKMDEWRRY